MKLTIGQEVEQVRSWQGMKIRKWKGGALSWRVFRTAWRRRKLFLLGCQWSSKVSWVFSLPLWVSRLLPQHLAPTSSFGTIKWLGFWFVFFFKEKIQESITQCGHERPYFTGKYDSRGILYIRTLWIGKEFKTNKNSKYLSQLESWSCETHGSIGSAWVMSK